VSFIRVNYLLTHFGTLDPSNMLCVQGSEDITKGRQQQGNWDRRRAEVIVLLSFVYDVSVNLYKFGDS
jgi:hypothetical protein